MVKRLMLVNLHFNRSILQIMKELCNCILNNVYFKTLFVVIFASVLTFVDDVDFLKNKYSLLIIVGLLVLLLFTQDCDRGAIVMVFSLLILAANNVINHQKQSVVA